MTHWHDICLSFGLGCVIGGFVALVFVAFVFLLFKELYSNSNATERTEYSEVMHITHTAVLSEIWEMCEKNNRFLDDQFWISIPCAESKFTGETFSVDHFLESLNYIETKRTVKQIILGKQHIGGAMILMNDELYARFLVLKKYYEEQTKKEDDDYEEQLNKEQADYEEQLKKAN